MSAEATILEKQERIKGPPMEIRGIVEDFRMQTIGGLMAACELWNRAIILSLLSGADTWFGLKKNKRAIELSDSNQNYFWRVILTVPQ